MYVCLHGHLDMLHEIAAAGEALAAVRAVVRSFARVTARVQHQVLPVGERLRAELTRERLVPRVAADVPDESVLAGQLLGAVRTDERGSAPAAAIGGLGWGGRAFGSYRLHL